MSTILICKTSDRALFVSKALNHFRYVFSKARRVFIKPNLVSYEHYPTTTHPETLRTVIEELSGYELVVGDAPAVDLKNPQKIVESHPLTKICREYNCKMLNLYSCEMKKFRTSRGYKFKASTLPLGCDLTISLPVGKEHFACGFTGALKNQFGFLSKMDRILMHIGIKNIHRGIAELNTVFKPKLIILDLVETLLEAQELRHGGIHVKVGYMLAGTDPVAIDKAAIDILAKLDGRIGRAKSRHIKHVRLSADYGIGTLKYKLMQIQP